MAALASRPRRHRFAPQRLRDARAQTASYATWRDMNASFEPCLLPPKSEAL
jgi:hypothetical protein